MNAKNIRRHAILNFIPEGGSCMNGCFFTLDENSMISAYQDISADDTLKYRAPAAIIG
jgi:hypothetical protein